MTRSSDYYEPLAVNDASQPPSNQKGDRPILLQWIIILILVANVVAAVVVFLATQDIVRSVREFGSLPIAIETLSRPDPFIGLRKTH
ncbi:uncharacterized protein BT62DRAFT_930686 [Guyanagaster necrorhizus]|uniref:Uncharacterized protein n=1 Tax=Guyanagaster necrorhizus TaxID=856835 RepID=A0A9P7VW62_9AGAR|nr:uncharacterized protein BT62DRAFT_930686 [Guyanagaster necrorhizus MCA 3950]KAG7447657.1 hypothetical protein BT62DRAFT_930686 [Guyanagaster necrorhizus MCA 3950]